MMEIPVGKWCYSRDENMSLTGVGCPFSNMYESDAGEFNECAHPAFGVEVTEDKMALCPLRLPACLAAYPNGAVITITAKPSIEIGFIPKEQTVDPKTGATTFTDIELLEVSEIKPK